MYSSDDNIFVGLKKWTVYISYPFRDKKGQKDFEQPEKKKYKSKP